MNAIIEIMKRLFLLLGFIMIAISCTGQGIAELDMLRRQQVINETVSTPDPILTGLLGAWAFEDDGPVVDLVGSVDGTGTNGTTIETGADGNAVGVSSALDSYIDFGDPAGYDGMSAITVFIDWYPTLAGESGTSNIFGHVITNTAHVWHLGFNSSRQIRGRIRDAGALRDIISTNAYALNNWHRIALRWEGDGNPPKIEINGVDEYIGALNSGPMATTTQNINVSLATAYNAAGIRQATGYVDNAFVWDRYLSDAEMAQMFTGNPTYAELNAGGGGGGVGGTQPTMTDLVSYWSFDDNVTDLSGTNDGTINGNAAYTAGGKVGKYLDCDGNGDYALIPDDDSLSFTVGSPDAPWSYGGWYKFDNTNDASIVFSKRGTGSEYQLGWSGTTLQAYQYTDASNYLLTEVTWTPTIGQWYHIYITNNGGGVYDDATIYIDGVAQTIIDSTVGTYTGMPNTINDLAMGIYLPIPTNVASLDGGMDLIGLWDVELTADNITWIYETEDGGTLITD